MENKLQWSKYQRVSIFLYLAAGVFLLVYALGFITNVYLFYAYGSRSLVEFYHDMQKINNIFLWKAILVIVFALLLFMLELGNHPAGVFTLLIVIAITAASIFICVNSFVVLADARQQYSNLDLTSLDRYIQRGTIRYEYSTFTYDIGLGGYILFMLSTLLTAFTIIRNAIKMKEGEGNEQK